MLGRQASNNQFARYFYYIGRIKTIQLEYTEALNYLQEALRKAPQSGVVGFRITVNKCIAIVQLLKQQTHHTPKHAGRKAESQQPGTGEGGG